MNYCLGYKKYLFVTIINTLLLKQAKFCYKKRKRFFKNHVMKHF